ncbi:phage tail assembly protein [Yersinia enterocolitica]|uniref:phage tail assembly protein n=1 Tax=Yersinia enterocolitica TaxID=630 RepID=UPI001C8EC8E1|nr:phage tail assembly protein [Yersinia enterocolitica]MBX9488087.1 phage tail assembly protein [Yersinia enterocolitica]MBX9491535.1 phage tail assembly protein [Yersinia enterocolitica]
MSNTIVLQTPIKRGKSVIKEVSLTGALKQAGSLRGLKLYSIMTSDVDSLIKLLPRVTSPALTEVEIISMDTWDFAQLSQEVATFLQPASEGELTPTETPPVSLDLAK